MTKTLAPTANRFLDLVGEVFGRDIIIDILDPMSSVNDVERSPALIGRSPLRRGHLSIHTRIYETTTTTDPRPVLVFAGEQDGLPCNGACRRDRLGLALRHSLSKREA